MTVEAGARPGGRWIGGLLGVLVGLLVKDLGLRNVVSYWGPMTLPVLACGGLGALAWPTRGGRVVVGLAGALLAAWLVIAISPLSRALARPLVRRDAPGPADAIYVLSSNVQSDDEPTPAALARATRGLELLGAGLAPRLYLSELGPPAGSYVAYLTRSAARMGLHAEAIADVGRVGTTHDEAVRVAALFRARGWRRLLLVTSPAHSRRAAAAFEKAGVPEVVSVPSVETLYDLELMRTSDERLVAFGPIVHEWIGLLVYRLRGWV